MQKFIVYKHVNKINGKMYIGLTCQKPQDRWRKGGKAYKGSPRFYNAIKHYGWDNFEHEILFENLTEEEAKQKETELILEYKTNTEDYGYNLTEGGEHNTPNQEVKDKIAAANKIKMNNGTREKIKESLKDRDFTGKNNPYFGKHHSEEIRKKMSENHWSKKNPEKFKQLVQRNGVSNPACKKVVRLIDGKIYDYMQKCAEDNNLKSDSIALHCNKKRKYFEYMFLSDFEKLTLEEKQELQQTLINKKNNPKAYHALNKQVIQIIDKQIFPSVQICHQQTNVSVTTIVNHCKNQTKTGKPVDIRKFMYLTEWENLSQFEKDKLYQIANRN